MLSVPVQRRGRGIGSAAAHVAVKVPGHRRHAREQIEVLILYYIIIILIFMRSAGSGSVGHRSAALLYAYDSYEH